MLPPLMLIFIGMARVTCDMVPLGDDSNYTTGHSSRLVRLDGAICTQPVSPQAQPLQSVTLQADKMVETTSLHYFSMISFVSDDVLDADVFENPIPTRHSLADPSGSRCCTLLDFEDFDPGGSNPCFEAYYTVEQVPGPHSSIPTSYDPFLERSLTSFCNLTLDPEKCLHFQSSKCTIVGDVPELFDAESCSTRSLTTLGMLLPPLFIVVEIINVLISSIIGLISMLLSICWSFTSNSSADFSSDLPFRRSLHAVLHTAFLQSIHLLPPFRLYYVAHTALIHGSKLLISATLSPLYIISVLHRQIFYAFLAEPSCACCHQTPRTRLGRKCDCQWAKHLGSYCHLPIEIDETENDECQFCTWDAYQCQCHCPGCRPDPMDYVNALCVTLFSGSKVCLQACLAFTSWIVACAARIALAWIPISIFGQSASCLMKIMKCIFITSLRTLFMKNYHYAITRHRVRQVYQISLAKVKSILYFTILLYFPLVVSAAGRNEATMMFQEFFLPGVDKWDGLPFHNFRRVWWVALCAALGTISQDAWSLLQTARDQDLGGPGNPGTAAQTVQSQNRNQRLFGAILNYIDATSYIYRYVSANFANDGRGLFN